MTGNRVAHPLLISLANINMDFRVKASNHLFQLLALLPIPRFICHKKLKGVLESRLFHECLDIVLAPLKKAAEFGIMMTDPLGWKRFCYTPLAGYIVDTPESALIACVAGKTSSVTMAHFKQFGDDFRHEPRTASTTIAKLMKAEESIDPWANITEYLVEVKQFRLNGVHRPFWRDYPLADPSIFLTSEPLHHWHKQFWDHDAKWCIYAVGGSEIDFRFSVLRQHTGFRHFKEGISTLKQVTGREHRNIQRYIVAVTADAVAPRFLLSIRALADFRYFAQSDVIDDSICARITQSLQEFHANKQAILDAGARRGKKTAIQHWQIPKLEFMQSVVSNIQLNGVAAQWSADVTEHAHIEVVKDPGRSGNNQDHEAQICRSLDRSDKLRQFDLATSIKEANIDFRSLLISQPEASSVLQDRDETLDLGNNMLSISTTADLLANIESVSPLSSSSHPMVDYFDLASRLKEGRISSPFPLRTHQSSSHVTFHLNRDPTGKRALIDDIAKEYQLPDLRAALGDYLRRIRMASGNSKHISTIGGRRTCTNDCSLPFTHLEVWHHVRLQCKGYHPPHKLLPATTVKACPPSTELPSGSYDSVIVNVDPKKNWPSSGLDGIEVC